MYRWYRSSQIRYVYLIDVGHETTRDEKNYYLTTFEHSRWFRRTWFLQELIAPEVVEFYDVDGREIGTKLSLLETISDVTAIDTKFSREPLLFQMSMFHVECLGQLKESLRGWKTEHVL